MLNVSSQQTTRYNAPSVDGTKTFKVSRAAEPRAKRFEKAVLPCSGHQVVGFSLSFRENAVADARVACSTMLMPTSWVLQLLRSTAIR